MFRFDAVIPQLNYNPKVLQRELDKAYKRLASQMRRDFEKTVSTWKKKPKFKIKKVRGSSISYTVSTGNAIYGYVTLGTVPHIIRPKRAKMLRFYTGGSPKTTPNILKSGPGTAGTNLRFAKLVKHPGTEARNFHIIIAKRFQQKAVIEANKVLRFWVAKYTREPSKRRRRR